MGTKELGFGVKLKPEIMPHPRAKDNTSPDTVNVTVVVPAFNEGKNLTKCLDSITSNIYSRGNTEILIVDGNSTDNTKDVAQAWIDSLRQKPYSGYTARLLSNPKRTAATGMNTGFKAADGDVVIPFSAHAYMSNDFIEKNIECLEKTDSDVCGGIVISAPDSPSWIAKAIGCALNTRFALGGITARTGNRIKEMDNPSFGAYRRDVLHKHGYMCESLIRNTDYEFNMRLKRAGEKITFYPDIKSFYYNRKTIFSLYLQYFYTSYYKAYMIGRYTDVIKLRHLAPPLFFMALFLFAVLSVVNSIFIYPFFALFGTYMLTSVVFSLANLKYILALPIIYLTIHLGYGLGFIAGFLNFTVLRNKPHAHQNG